MKIVIIGPNGQLGSTFIEQFTSMYDKTEFQIQPVPHSALDITKPAKVKEFFKFEQPEIVINCAGYTNVDLAESESGKCYKVNANGVENLLNATHTFGSLFITFSSDYVFDGTYTTPYTESSYTNPLSIYGKSKRMADRLVRGYNNYYNIRTSGLFVRGHQNFVTGILDQAANGKVIRVVQDQFAHLTYIPHLVNAIISLIRNRPRYGSYNLVNSGVDSWFEYAKRIVQMGGYDVEVHPVLASEFGGAARRPPRTELSISKFQTSTNDRMPTWVQGLDDFFYIDKCNLA